MVFFCQLLGIMQSPPPPAKSTPTLAEVLSDIAPYPWTLDAFADYLATRHCMETLEFIKDASSYRECYAQLARTNISAAVSSTLECDHLQNLWGRLLDTYIIPNGPQEVNLPCGVKTRLLATRHSDIPPNPSILEPAVNIVYDLMVSSSQRNDENLPRESKHKFGWKSWWK
jgi:hypothetical protein